MFIWLLLPIMSLYSYIPLRDNEIRLLQIPVQPDGPYELLHVNVNETPKYIALSYTWGKSDFCKHIRIDNGILNITENLFEGLLVLRERLNQSGYCLWVDFICIDEQNVEERNAQVSIMKSIYENAEEVYVWLGVSSEDSDLAMRKIGDFGRYLNGLSAQHDNDLHRAVGTLSPEDPTIFGEEGSETFKSWNSIAVLLRRDRWFRAWIIQEATVSMSVTFFCGTSSVSWKAIMYTISIADQLSSFPGLETMSSLGEGFCHRLISLCMSRESRKPRSLMDIMIDFRQSECTDPRDKIYSKLGLATDVAPGDIAVRYDKPIDEVYMDLVRWSYDKGHPFHQLDFLGCVIRSAEKPSQMQMPDRVVPTWVPDWRGALRAFGPTPR